jgi:hypothetical protein
VPSKTAILLPLVCLAALACSSVQHPDLTGVEQMRLSDLTRNPEAFAKAIGKDGPGVILLMKKGDALPLQLTANLKFARIVSGRNRLVFDQDVYVHLSPSGIRISPDGKTWAPIQDTGVVEQAFGIDGGQMTFGFGISESYGPHGKIAVETH